MAEPASISRQQISDAVRASVEKVLQGRHAAFTQPGHTIGFVPQPPHWLGIIYNEPKIAFPHGEKQGETKDGKNNEAQKLADDIVAATKSVPGLKVGQPAVVYGHGHVTIGFLPSDAPRDEHGHLGPLSQLGHLVQ